MKLVEIIKEYRLCDDCRSTTIATSDRTESPLNHRIHKIHWGKDSNRPGAGKVTRY